MNNFPINNHPKDSSSINNSPIKHVIELKNIRRVYTNSEQPLTVLKGVNLSIAAGEMVRVV